MIFTNNRDAANQRAWAEPYSSSRQPQPPQFVTEGNNAQAGPGLRLRLLIPLCAGWLRSHDGACEERVVAVGARFVDEELRQCVWWQLGEGPDHRRRCSGSRFKLAVRDAAAIKESLDVAQLG